MDYYYYYKLHFFDACIFENSQKNNRNTYTSFRYNFIDRVSIKINKFSKKNLEESKNKTCIVFLKKYKQKCICFFLKILTSHFFLKINSWIDIILTDIKVNIEDFGIFFISMFTTRFNNIYNYELYSEINSNDKLNLLLKKKTFRIINIVDSIFFMPKNKTSSELIDRIFITFQGSLGYPIKDIKCILECGRILLNLDEFKFMHIYI
ncbi:unnamed protein product [Pneumocystis jirovecii]|uniref:Uncharacterized protein n=1 Tax=Pneumocystis jirovecii TaxID=42068 RepID=L0PC26_PNEJI|nr:unnamed protein product [Pneumocystis jirovecii]